MNLQYLKAFYVTVKLNSISKAAKELHLTQPGLSMQLQSLEKDLGVTLLTRSNKGVDLTEAGMVVFDYAGTILSMQDNVERDLENLKSNKKDLIIGSCKAVGEYALPCSIYVFKHDNKNIDINYTISNSSEVIKNLVARTINIGIIHSYLTEKNIKLEKITSDRLILATSLPIIKNRVTLEELNTLPLIFREEGSGTRETIKQHLKSKNVKIKDLNILYELNSAEAIKSSVISGKGISFIPELTIKRELKDGVLREIEIEDLNIVSEFYIAYREDHQFTSFENRFIDFIKSSKRGFC